MIPTEPTRRRHRVASLLLVAFLLATVVGAPAVDALAHGHGDPHTAIPHLHSPEDESCPPPHPWACLLCRVARTPLQGTGWTLGPDLPATEVLSVPGAQALPRRLVAASPVGARAPPHLRAVDDSTCW